MNTNSVLTQRGSRAKDAYVRDLVAELTEAREEGERYLADLEHEGRRNSRLVAAGKEC